MPKVTVIINCYNGELYLRQAIDSVYRQTYDDWEIVFWDNASTDGSAEITRSYDARLRYFRGDTNVPLGAARKLALAQARGEWIAFLDCDDWWLPEKLSVQMAALKGSNYVLCYSGIAEVRPDGRPIRHVLPAYGSGDMLAAQLRQFDINMVSAMVHQPTMQRYGLDFEQSIVASEEYNLFMRLAAKGPVCTLPRILAIWRISPGSLTDRAIARWAEERYYTLQQLEAENPQLSECFGEALRHAYARGDYYRARYLVHKGQRIAAARTLLSAGRVDARYKALAATLFVPGMWRLVHSQALKRAVLPRLMKIARYA